MGGEGAADHPVLKCTYGDLITKPALSKPIKGFVPDTGIPSLKTALEYKFIENEREGKEVLDEILADIGGYRCEAYETFVFVVYETIRLFPEDEWKTAIEASEPRTNVEVVALHGTVPTEADQKASSELKEKRKAAEIKGGARSASKARRKRAPRRRTK